ncbi:unnamed protein product, partial [Staurois parvus]
FTRAPDGGDGLETVPGQVTTSEQARQWLRRPLGTGTGRARYEEDAGSAGKSIRRMVRAIRVKRRSRQNSQDNPGQKQEQAE